MAWPGNPPQSTPVQSCPGWAPTELISLSFWLVSCLNQISLLEMCVCVLLVEIQNLYHRAPSCWPVQTSEQVNERMKGYVLWMRWVVDDIQSNNHQVVVDGRTDGWMDCRKIKSNTTCPFPSILASLVAFSPPCLDSSCLAVWYSRKN